MSNLMNTIRALYEAPEDMEPASPDEKSMAMKQAEFIQYVGREVKEHLEANKEFPEWMQNKLSGLNEKAKDMHATLGAHGEDDMNEGINHDRYMRAHGKKASGTGRWMFTTAKTGQGKEVYTGNGKLADVAKQAMKVLKSKEVYVMESVEITESHFEVGDEVKCKASGMSGKVTKVDPEEEGKYYTVKRSDGKTMKYAPDELVAESLEEGFTVHVDDGREDNIEPHTADQKFFMDALKKFKGKVKGQTDKGVNVEFPNIRAQSNFVHAINKMSPKKTMHAEGLEDPKDNPCWKGYEPVGTKKKNGKTVPNCVPKEEKIMNEQWSITGKDRNGNSHTIYKTKTGGVYSKTGSGSMTSLANYHKDRKLGTDAANKDLNSKLSGAKDAKSAAALANQHTNMRWVQEELQIDEALEVKLRGGKVPVGQHRFKYDVDKSDKYIENSIKERDPKATVERKGKDLWVTASAGAHSSVIASMRRFRVNGTISEGTVTSVKDVKAPVATPNKSGTVNKVANHPGSVTAPVTLKKEKVNIKKFGSSQIKKAVALAKKMGGDMTGAVKAIEKMAKGLSQDVAVKNALRLANENWKPAKNKKLKEFLNKGDKS